MPAGSFKVYLERNCESGKPWAVRLTGVSAYPTLTVEFYGAIGGIFRYFPRGRDQMIAHFQHPNPGQAYIFVTARNEQCLGVQACHGSFTIAPASSQSMMRTPLRDDDGDDWQSQMDEIDRRFSWETRKPTRTPERPYRGDDVDGYDPPPPRPYRGDDVDGYDPPPRPYRGDDVDGYDPPPRPYRGDDVDGYNLRNLVSLPAIGKPPIVSTWHPNSPSGAAGTPHGTAAPTRTASGDLSDLINAKTQDLLNRLGKR